MPSLDRELFYVDRALQSATPEENRKSTKITIALAAVGVVLSIIGFLAWFGVLTSHDIRWPGIGILIVGAVLISLSVDRLDLCFRRNSPDRATLEAQAGAAFSLPPTGENGDGELGRQAEVVKELKEETKKVPTYEKVLEREEKPPTYQEVAEK